MNGGYQVFRPRPEQRPGERTELEFDRDENEDLAPRATHTGRGREMTGYIEPD